MRAAVLPAVTGHAFVRGLLVVAALAGFGAGRADAQNARPLKLGESVRVEGGGSVEIFEFAGLENMVVDIYAETGRGKATLSLYFDNGTRIKQVRDKENPKLTTYLSYDGRYFVSVARTDTTSRLSVGVETAAAWGRCSAGIYSKEKGWAGHWVTELMSLPASLAYDENLVEQWRLRYQVALLAYGVDPNIAYARCSAAPTYSEAYEMRESDLEFRRGTGAPITNVKFSYSWKEGDDAVPSPAHPFFAWCSAFFVGKGGLVYSDVVEVPSRMVMEHRQKGRVAAGFQSAMREAGFVPRQGMTQPICDVLPTRERAEAMRTTLMEMARKDGPGTFAQLQFKW